MLGTLVGTVAGKARLKVTKVKRRESGRAVVCGPFFVVSRKYPKICNDISHGTRFTFGEYSTRGAMKNGGLAIVHMAMDTVDFETADMVCCALSRHE